MSLDQRLISQRLLSLSAHLAESGRIKSFFGVAGDPITPLISSCESNGIQFFGFRNEQAASYAASIVSFLTCRQSIGVCVTVAGPGFTNALTGSANACKNEWPMILICPLVTRESDFQSLNQTAILSSSFCRGFFVYNESIDSVNVAIKLALDQNGPVVLFVANDFRPHQIHTHSKIPNSRFGLDQTAHFARPLIVIGSMAPMYPQIAADIRSVVEEYRIPFFADPMGRGVIPESHELCVTASKNSATSTCSVAIIVCGKLDWMLHHGKSPKWKKDCVFLFVQPDGGDSIRAILPKKIEVDSQWIKGLMDMGKQKKLELGHRLQAALIDNSLPTHWQAIGAVKKILHKHGLLDSIIVSEGANTMDVCRVALDDVSLPQKRLDAGRWGTMGSGLGFVVAACSLNPNKVVIAIEGDSALGFSGMELETIARYKCRSVIIVFNNGGIYTGIRENATALGSSVCHAKLMEAVGGFGVTSRSDPSRPEIFLDRAINLVNQGKFPVLVDLIIDPKSGTVSGSLSRM